MLFTPNDEAIPTAPRSAAPLWLMAAGVIAVCLLGVGSLVAGYWQALTQGSPAPLLLGDSGEFLGAALVPLLGLLTPMILAFVVILQGQQLRHREQLLAHARYEFVIESALRQRRTPAPAPPIGAVARSQRAPRSHRVAPAANQDDFSRGCTLGLAVQTAPLLTPAAVIRAMVTTIAMCETRLALGADEVDARELHQLMHLLRRRLQLLEDEIASSRHE